jgi:hypothetical protein
MDKDLKPLYDESTEKRFKEHAESWNNSPLPNNWRELLKASRNNYIENFGKDVFDICGAEWVYNDLEELFSATDCREVDVAKIKRPAIEGFKDEVINGILSELREEFPSLDSEHASFKLACKRFYDYLASRNLIRGAIPDDMVLLPKETPDCVLAMRINVTTQLGTSSIDANEINDLYQAMTNAYEEGK